MNALDLYELIGDLSDQALIGELLDHVDACESCGCSEDDPCPGGCAWSTYFAQYGRMVCTSCEAVWYIFHLNLRALGLFMSGDLLSPQIAGS